MSTEAKQGYFSYEQYKSVNKVNKCSYINDNLKNVIFYLCACNTEFSPICKACALECHRKHLGKVRIVGNYTCICGKQNHLVKKLQKKKRGNVCFFAKLFEITPNRGFYKNPIDNKQYCSVCHDSESCLYRIGKKKSDNNSENESEESSEELSEDNNNNINNENESDNVNLVHARNKSGSSEIYSNNIEIIKSQSEGSNEFSVENSNNENNRRSIKKIIEDIRKKLIYVPDSNNMICMCRNRNHNLNAISLHSDLTSHKNLNIYMRSFNVNILFKIQSSKQTYMEGIVKLIESFNNNPTSIQNFEIFVEYTNNSIFKTLSYFNKRWKNKYVYINPFLDNFTFEQLINFLKIHKDTQFQNPISTNLFFTGKFFFAELLFSYFIKSHIVRHNHLLNMKTILNLDITHRMLLVRNAKTYFKYNLDKERANQKDNTEFINIEYIDILSKEFVNILREFTQRANNFESQDFKAPLKSITYIFKYLIKYNLIDFKLIDEYFDLILDCLYSFIKSEKENNLSEGYESIALSLIKSIIYCIVYRNDQIIIDKYVYNNKNSDDFFFKINDTNLRLIKVFFVIFPYFNKKLDYKKRITFDFCVRKLVEFGLFEKDSYSQSLKLTKYIGIDFLKKYKSFKINPELYILEEEKKNIYFQNLYNTIANFTKKIGNENRLYFNFEIPFRLYNKRINYLFQDFRQSVNEIKQIISADLESKNNIIGETNNSLNFSYRTLDSNKDKTDKTFINIFKKIILLTDLMENLEEFIYIYSKGIEYRETEFDLESELIDIDMVPNYLLKLFTEIIEEGDPLLILIITNIKPEIFVPALIRKEHELNENERPDILKKDKLIKFLEKLLETSKKLKVHIDIFPFYLGCIRELIFLKGLDKSCFYLTHILNLIAKVMKKAFENDSKIISIISLINDLFKKIKDDQKNFKKINNFFKDNVQNIDLENFYQKYFYFMSELILNDIQVLDVLTHELVSIEQVEDFIMNILNNEDRHEHKSLNYLIMRYYFLKKLSFNISQNESDDIMANLFNRQFNPNYDISILRLTAKNTIKDDECQNDLEKKYTEICNVLTILKSILLNYYNPNKEEIEIGSEEDIHNKNFFDNILVDSLRKILHILLLYDKIEQDLNVLLFNDCIQILNIKRNNIFEEENEKLVNSNISLSKTASNPSNSTNQVVHTSMMYKDPNVNTKVKLSYLFIKFNELFPNQKYQDSLNDDDEEEEEINEYLDYYESEKENIKNENLTFIEGFKILQRETGQDYRKCFVNYLIHKNFDPLNENYILPTFIQTINKDLVTLDDNYKQKIQNNYITDVYLPDKIDDFDVSNNYHNPNFENAYSILILNKMLEKDSSNFQRVFESVFLNEEGEEYKTIFLSYIIKKLIFTCVMLQCEKYYNMKDITNSPIYLTGIFSINFIQNLCEGHNQNSQNYFYNSNFVNKRKKGDILKKKKIDNKNNSKHYDYLLVYYSTQSDRKFLGDFKRKKDQRINDIQSDSSFFNFLFFMLRIIMNTVYPLSGHSKILLRNISLTNTNGLDELYTAITELIIEMLQGCAKVNYKYLYEITSDEVFTILTDLINNGENYNPNPKMRQYYQPMINLYEVSQLIFKGASSLKIVFKDPSKFKYKVPNDITFDNKNEMLRFTEICLSFKNNQFKLLNNIVSQGFLLESQQKLISMIYNYNNLTTVITDLLVGIYNKRINNLNCECKEINLTPEKKRELTEMFKYGNLSEDEYFNLASEMFLFMTIMAEMYHMKDARECIDKRNLEYDETNEREENNKIITCQFFSEIIKSVEFKLPTIDSLSLKTIYFIVNPKFYNISKSTIQKFLDNVDRTNSSTKLGELIRILDFLMNEASLIKNPNELIDFGIVIYYNFIASFFINTILLLYHNELPTNKFLHSLIEIFSITQLLINILLLYRFFQTKYLFYVEITRNKYDKITSSSTYEKIINFIHIYILNSFLFNEEILLLNFIILMGIFGIISKYYLFFYVLQLLTVINFTDTIFEIVQAFYIRFTQLICMIGFLGILIFFFSNIGFFYYIDEFNATINNEITNYCNSLLDCYILYFNHGVRAGGGIGDVLPEKSFSNLYSYFIRWLTDLIFYIAVILLLLNMINGVIVSTFSQIRELSQIKEEDINGKCFICGQSQEDFEKKRIDFNKHVNNEHNILNYIMFFVKLKSIKEKDLDSDQSYIAQKLEDLDIAFFPVGETHAEDDF